MNEQKATVFGEEMSLPKNFRACGAQKKPKKIFVIEKDNNLASLLEKEFKKFKTKVRLHKFKDQASLLKNNIYIVDVPLEQKKISLTKKNEYISKSFKIGLNLLKKNSFALINGPISKTTFLKGKFNGITEFLAFKTRSLNEVMLIFNKELSVCPITTHVPINKVSQKIKKKLIVNKIKNIHIFYKKFLGYKPSIAVTGLNPHCETFMKKNIEKTEILPAIKFLKKKKIKISGPFSAEGSKKKSGFPIQPDWFKDARGFGNLEKGLNKAGFSSENINDILGNNWFNFYKGIN